MEQRTPFVIAVLIGRPQQYGDPAANDPAERAWSSAIVKDAVQQPIWLASTNLDGDAQADRRHHGGPDKALCIYPAGHYPYWRSSLPKLPLGPGAFGENLTVAGQNEDEACIGDRYFLGTAQIQISQPRQPCWKLARRWGVTTLAAQVQQTGRTGWYCRVLREGWVAAELPLLLAARPCPEWPVAVANRVMHQQRHDREATAALAACPLLSASWRATLTRRLDGGDVDPAARLYGAPEHSDSTPTGNSPRSV
jgi:MOSC domain-containing protein YiiM